MTSNSTPDPLPEPPTDPAPEPPRRVLTPQEAAEYFGKVVRERAEHEERRRRRHDCGWL